MRSAIGRRIKGGEKLYHPTPARDVADRRSVAIPSIGSRRSEYQSPLVIPLRSCHLHVEASYTKEELPMTPMFLRACGVAAALGVSMAAFAQTTGQQPASPQPRTQTAGATSQAGPAAGQTVTVSGCIQGEADYRKAHNLA